jgi:hypothetical protein
MADTRINALSTATSSVSDDFVPIDGTTNGTRKLSAFSPSFGGNATVGGTLTAGGDITISTNTKAFYNLNYATVKGTQAGFFSRGTVSGWTSGIHFYTSSNNYSATFSHEPSSGTLSLFTNNSASDYTASDVALAVTVDKQIQVKATTASTTTSSGALVVSGGVGVAGAGYFGGVLNISSTAGLYAQWKKTDNASGSQSWSWIGDNNGTIYLQAANDNFVGANNYISFTRSGVTPGTTTIHSTTASTSTSSGALVVSGGVGVAKRIYSGEGLDTAGDNATHISLVRNGTVSIGPDSTATPALVISTSIQTSAPSGGTAAKWKLGTVASVSPTSPNRTIEVEIGGTTYYLHAKTTNN